MTARERLERICGPQTPPELITELDVYRAEVLAADGQAYDGELAMYRGLVRTIRVVVREDDNVTEVRRLVHEHAADDAAARAQTGEKATAEAPPAAPDFFERDHTYSKLRGTWLFRCAHVAKHPAGSDHTAFGWIRRNEQYQAWTAIFKGEASWALDGWTDVTEAGEDR